MCVGYQNSPFAEPVPVSRNLGADAVIVTVPRDDVETTERFADEVAPEFG